MAATAHAARQHDAHPSAELYVTYFASALETGRRSGTYRKLEAIVKDFDRSGGADAPCNRRRRGLCGGGYRRVQQYHPPKKAPQRAPGRIPAAARTRSRLTRLSCARPSTCTA